MRSRSPGDDHRLTTLRTNLNVPRNAGCLSSACAPIAGVPEYAGDEHRDAFTAELDRSTWDARSETNPVITASDNVAFDIPRRAMNVNSEG